MLFHIEGLEERVDDINQTIALIEKMSQTGFDKQAVKERQDLLDMEFCRLGRAFYMAYIQAERNTIIPRLFLELGIE